ncbi:MAG: hypothetical protein ACTMH0_11325 [Brevibacterium linens]|uniref:hypothetical protein n=1 Tax=Brevibacterium linens TaxID=1703 RepID=UPI003F960308
MSQNDVDAEQIAQSLKTDPIYIDPAVADTLDGRLLDKAEATVKELDFDVYVVAVDAEHGSIDREMLEQIKVLNGSEGSFVMIDDGTAIAVDTYFTDAHHDKEMEVVDQQLNAHDEWNTSTPSVSKLNILLDLYEDPQEHVESGDTGAEQQPGSDVIQDTGSGGFAPLFLGGSILVLALVIGGIFIFRSMRAKAAEARRRDRFRLPSSLLHRVDHLQRSALREDINSEATELASSLDQLRTDDLSSAELTQVERAFDAYYEARSIVDDEAAERIDLAGAMVLLRQARREIGLAGQSRGARSSRPESLCTVNPLHGEARTTSPVSVGVRAVRVPVCSACEGDLRGGRDLQWIFDKGRPYIEAESVWAETLFGAIGGNLVTALKSLPPR